MRLAYGLHVARMVYNSDSLTTQPMRFRLQGLSEYSLATGIQTKLTHLLANRMTIRVQFSTPREARLWRVRAFHPANPTSGRGVLR